MERVFFYGGRPRVFKKWGMWWVQTPGYHNRRYLRWADAIEAACDWWQD